MNGSNLEFAKVLVDLVFLVTPIQRRFDIYRIILRSLTVELKIKQLVVLKVLKMFRIDPNMALLDFLLECIAVTGINNKSTSSKLCDVHFIPIGWREVYVKRILPVLEKVQILGSPEYTEKLIYWTVHKMYQEVFGFLNRVSD